jgi:hypothetical protein
VGRAGRLAKNRHMRLIFFTLLCPLLAAPLHAREYRPPRLADGAVDLQGVWSHTNITPLERHALAKSLVITSEEAAAIEAKINASNEDLSKPAEPSLYFDKRTIEPIGGELRSSIIVEPADGKVPGNALYKELIAQARAALLTAFDGPEQRPGSERCLSAPSAAPPIMMVPAGDLRRIVQTRDTILMATEELHEARVIRMNAKHTPAAITSWLGDSIGRWDGDTLAIETTHFAPTSLVRAGPAGAFLVSPNMVVIERIRRIADDELAYEFTVNDPTYYTQEWRGETRFKRSDARMLEYACHEGNYSLEYVLRGRESGEPTLSKR